MVRSQLYVCRLLHGIAGWWWVGVVGCTLCYPQVVISLLLKCSYTTDKMTTPVLASP